MVEIIEFTPDQQKAITHDKGHLRIIACAGAGKTEVISQRIANLIKNGTNPEKIVAFTFTRKAAEELKSRIRRILDRVCPNRADFGEMFVGTIDAFCFQMLQKLEPKYKSYEILEDAKRVAYLSKRNNFNRLGLWSLKKSTVTGNEIKQYTIIDRFIYSSDIVMMEDIDPDKLTNLDFKNAYLEYRKILDEDRYLDFSSVVLTLVNLLRRNKDILDDFNNKIRYLIVDEYQDINKMQEELIKLISFGASICVVGDDDQCVYQWRGSKVENIIGFSERYSKNCSVVDIPLNMNFRSTSAIIHLAETFIQKNKKRLSIKKMISNPNLERSYEVGDIVHKHFNTDAEEAQFIIKKINELKGTDFVDKRNNPYSLSLGDFAVLVRTNEDASKIIPYFEKNNIDCVSYNGESIFNREEVKLAMNCIHYVFDPSYISFLDNLVSSSYEVVFNKEKFPKADISKFKRKIEKIRQEIERIRTKSPQDYLGDLGLQEIYHRILNAMGAEDFDFGEVIHFNLAVLSQAISDYESVWKRLRVSEIKDFFTFVYLYGKSHYSEIQHNDNTLVNAIKILTIHKAKGLEFPVVFIPGLVEKNKLPDRPSFVDSNLYDSASYNGTPEDERRVFYTAITRSEKYLFLTGAVHRENKQKNYNPHNFIAELDKKYISDDFILDRKKTGHPPRLGKSAIYPTSFSELSSYDRCPYDFKMRHVWGYNAGVPVAFGYGANIHNILNIIHNKYLKDKKIPSEKNIDVLFDKLFHLRYATKKIEENMKKAGKKVVKNYLRIHKNDFKYILQTEKNFEFVLDEAIVSGQIDLLKKLDNSGNLTEVEIIDFKTDKEKEKNAYDLDHVKQLRFYTIACMQSLGLDPKKACIHHLDNSILNRKEYVDISEKYLNKTKEEIKGDVKKILTKHFSPKPSGKCTKCDYRYLCSNKKFKLCK